MTDILNDSTERSYAFLSGPSFAQEIFYNQVARKVVVASEGVLLARDMVELLSDESFRVFVWKDVVGVEIGGAVKNVTAGSRNVRRIGAGDQRYEWAGYKGLR